MKITTIEHPPASVGECPVYDKSSNTLYWIDVYAPKFFTYELESKTFNSYDTQDIFCCIDIALNGKLYGIANDNFLEINIDNNKLSTKPVINNLISNPKVRFNDGKFDAKGRFWSGTIDLQQKQPLGNLFKIETNGTITSMDNNITVANGTDFSPDNKILYFTDSMVSKLGKIYCYDYDLQTGSINNRRDFITYRQGQGVPDGLCVAPNGDIFVAVWEGTRVDHYNKDGKLIDSIKLTARNVTCPCIGGPDNNLLFVTSSTEDLEGEINLGPNAGQTFIVELDK